jgi:hypothetical protein
MSDLARARQAAAPRRPSEAAPPADRPFDDAMKRCSGCGTEKPLDEFYWHQGGRDSLRAKCKECMKKAARAHRLANPEQRAELRHKLRTCAGCSIVFTTTRTDARYCSAACRQKACLARSSSRPSGTRQASGICRPAPMLQFIPGELVGLTLLVDPALR